HGGGLRERARQVGGRRELTADRRGLVQLQSADLVGRCFHADILNAASQRDRVLALIPGPHLSRERVCRRRGGSLRGRGGLGSTTGERKQGERTESEPTLGFHAPPSLTNAVPANAIDLSHVCAAHVWTSFPGL